MSLQCPIPIAALNFINGNVMAVFMFIKLQTEKERKKKQRTVHMNSVIFFKNININMVTKTQTTIITSKKKLET